VKHDTSPSNLEEALSPIRRRIHSHGGDVRVANVKENGAVEVEFLGACVGCPAANFTFTTVVVPAIRDAAGDVQVTSGQARYSPLVAERLRRIERSRRE
jgi:Fe-S cluster biogenesis protein NfuA